MAKRRMIASTIWEDDWFGPLPFFEQALWIGLWSKCADDQGRLLGNAMVIRAAVFPYKDVAMEDIDSALATFAAAGRICHYADENKRLIQILHWWEHQPQQWASASKWLPPPGWTDHVRCKEDKKIKTVNWRGKYGNAADNVNWSPSPEASPEDQVQVPTEVQVNAQVAAHINDYIPINIHDDVNNAADAASPQAHHHHPPDGEEENVELAKVACAWQDMNPRRQVTDMDRQALAELCDEYGSAEVLTGLYVCNEYSKPHLAYLRKVLQSRREPNTQPARASPVPEDLHDAPALLLPEQGIELPWWDDFVARAQAAVAPKTWETWLASAGPLSYSDGVVVIGVRGSYAKDWCENRLYGTLQGAATAAAGQKVSLRFIVRRMGRGPPG